MSLLLRRVLSRRKVKWLMICLCKKFYALHTAIAPGADVLRLTCMEGVGGRFVSEHKTLLPLFEFIVLIPYNLLGLLAHCQNGDSHNFWLATAVGHHTWQSLLTWDLCMATSCVMSCVMCSWIIHPYPSLFSFFNFNFLLAINTQYSCVIEFIVSK